MFKFEIALFLCATVFVQRTSASDFVLDQGVLVLSNNDFELARERFDNLFVEFYSTWCGHCKSMAPEYIKAAQMLTDRGANVQLAKVDAELEDRLRKEYKITNYPTFKFFVKGKNKILDYSAGRHADDIVNYIEKKIGQPAREVNTIDEAKALLDQEIFFLFAFAKSLEVRSVFEQVAFDNDKYLFAITSDPVLFSEFHVNEDTIVAFKKYDEGKAELTGDITYETIKKFILDHHLPLVSEFSEENAEKIFTTGISKHAVLFIRKSDAHSKIHFDSFQETALAFRGKVVFLYVDLDDDDNHKVLEFFGLTLDETPAVRFVDLTRPSDPIKYNPTSADLGQSSIQAFVDGVLNGKIKPFFKSDPVPADWNDKPVKVLVGKNFQEVLDQAVTSKNVIVLFYAPWCGHCKKLEPIWEELGERYAQNPKVLVAKMDSTTNELENMDIKNFPSVKLFIRGTKDVVDYSGERSLMAISAFVDSNGKVVVVVPNTAAEPVKDEL
ncbi:hypothetical protein HELRODRAFT_194128 [Helobdella robusta]|uniref:protein disulfide-isomerase n=1 Tax=Helobdella robusta TaxID=6412 RepID=T1FVQ2_HELRO|nr:hypothetical protein HELRODRAFT_194128 [Helobdella robusta]ESN93312.1 hypothetical protein HELRODRAFT_194128 [Helobdella robusta]